MWSLSPQSVSNRWIPSENSSTPGMFREETSANSLTSSKPFTILELQVVFKEMRQNKFADTSFLVAECFIYGKLDNRAQGIATRWKTRAPRSRYHLDHRLRAGTAESGPTAHQFAKGSTGKGLGSNQGDPSLLSGLPSWLHIIRDLHIRSG